MSDFRLNVQTRTLKVISEIFNDGMEIALIEEMRKQTSNKKNDKVKIELQKSKDLPATIGLVEAVRDELKSNMDTRFTQVDNRFSEMQTQIDKQFSEVDTKFEEVNVKIDQLTNRIEEHYNRLFSALKVQETRNWQQFSENKFVLDRYNICIEKIRRLEESLLQD